MNSNRQFTKALEVKVALILRLVLKFACKVLRTLNYFFTLNLYITYIAQGNLPITYLYKTQ